MKGAEIFEIYSPVPQTAPAEYYPVKSYSLLEMTYWGKPGNLPISPKIWYNHHNFYRDCMGAGCQGGGATEVPTGGQALQGAGGLRGGGHWKMMNFGLGGRGGPPIRNAGD